MCGGALGTSHRFGAYAEQHAKNPHVFKRQSGEFTAIKHLETQNKHLSRGEIKPSAGFISSGPFNV
jgi:hypothetical protein